jgi:hypothetical protein
VLGRLAETLYHEGRYADAELPMREMLEIDRRVFGPEHPVTASAGYNVACILALNGNLDEALSVLRKAVDHGLQPRIDLGIEKDTDLKSLHGDSRFTALVAHAKDRAAAAK